MGVLVATEPPKILGSSPEPAYTDWSPVWPAWAFLLTIPCAQPYTSSNEASASSLLIYNEPSAFLDRGNPLCSWGLLGRKVVLLDGGTTIPKFQSAGSGHS